MNMLYGPSLWNLLPTTYSVQDRGSVSVAYWRHCTSDTEYTPSMGTEKLKMVALIRQIFIFLQQMETLELLKAKVPFSHLFVTYNFSVATSPVLHWNISFCHLIEMFSVHRLHQFLHTHQTRPTCVLVDNATKPYHDILPFSLSC